MGSWDDPIFENGFTFNGDLDRGNKFNIIAFTFGNAYQGWLSDKSNNVNSLASDAQAAAGRKKELIISAPQDGGIARFLNVRGAKYEHLRIYIYTDPTQQKLAKTLVFYGFKQVGQPQSLTFRKIGLSNIPIRLFTFKYNSMQAI